MVHLRKYYSHTIRQAYSKKSHDKVASIAIISKALGHRDLAVTNLSFEFRWRRGAIDKEKAPFSGYTQGVNLSLMLLYNFNYPRPKRINFHFT